jgi:hypothetical protein
MNQLSKTILNPFLSLTLDDFLEHVKNYTFRAYSYDTSFHDQEKITARLADRGMTVRIIRDAGDMRKWKSYAVDVLVIRNAGTIINSLKNLKPFEHLITGSRKFLIFFNGSIDVQIDSRKKRDKWSALVKDSKYCYEISFGDKENAHGRPAPRRNTLTMKAIIKNNTSKYILQAIRNLIYPPWTKGKISIVFLSLLLLLAGLFSLLIKLKFWPFLLTSLLASPLVIALMVYIVKKIREKVREGWIELVIIILVLLNLFVGLTVQEVLKLLSNLYKMIAANGVQ